MNLISTVLFGTQTRYWYTLLSSVASSLELYPGFTFRIYVTSDVYGHAASNLLGLLNDVLPVQVYEIAGPYTATEPSMWRLRPLWEPGLDTVLCRDIDSMPTTEEVKATRLWMNHPLAYPVHSIRSFHLHDTLIMAGLFGFKPDRLSVVRDQVPSFDTYIDLYRQHSCQCPNFVWGCDQEALRMLFNGIRSLVLDTPIGNCKPHPPVFGVPTATKEEIDKVSVTDLNAEILAICDNRMAEPWGDFKGFAGRPIGDSRAELQQLLKIENRTSQAVNKILTDYPNLKQFYTP